MVKHLNRILDRQVGESAIVAVQDPVTLGEYSEPQSDLALLKYREDFYAVSHPRPEDVLLLIEVADSTLIHDRYTKIPLYAKAGIREVWLIDLASKHLDVYRYPSEGRYTTQRRASDLKQVEAEALPGLSFDLTAVFEDRVRAGAPGES